MLTQNLLNGLENQREKHIYRYIKYAYFLNWLQTNDLYLCHPSKWADPFENYLLNLKLQFPDGKLKNFFERKWMFAQCWTLTKRETDAHWRIYSMDNEWLKIENPPKSLTTKKDILVRIRTTVSALWHYFINSSTIIGTGVNSCFLGKVNYISRIHLIELAKNPKNLEKYLGSQHGIIQSLLFKRTAFSHENELRLIFRLTEFKKYPQIEPTSKPNHMIIQDVNPCQFIDQIIFDPRISAAKFREKKEKLREFFPERMIKRSTLYTLPSNNNVKIE